MQIRLIDKISNLYIVIIICGFLFIGTVPILLGFSENSLSVPFRVIVLILSLFLIFITVFSRQSLKIKLSIFFLFFLFWVIYSIRILFDLFIEPIKLFPDNTATDYLLFAFGVVLIPSITVLVIQSNKINFDWILKSIYFSLFLTLIIAIYFRGNSDIQGRSVGDVNVGILLFGQSGATLSILSIYYLTKRKHRIFLTLFYSIGFIVGFIGIFVSASKSPFLALIVVLAAFFVLKYGGFKTLLILLIITLLLNYYFIEFLNFLNLYFNSNFFERILYSIEEGGDKVRGSLFEAAYLEFIDSPILGNAMLIQKSPYTGAYPHNLIMESFMATGFFGGLIFVLWVLKCLKKSINLLRYNEGNSWVALLFFQYLVFGMFSKNLYSSDLFWFTSLLVISIVAKQNKKVIL